MDRVFTSGASVTPPAAPASPSSGYATAGNPGLGTPATKPGPYWFHMITEELRALLVAAGLTPDHTNLGQVALAVQTIVNANSARSKIMSITGGTVAANAMTVGFPAQSLDFRSATLGNGSVTTITTGTLSLTIPSGATLGAVNGQQAMLILLVAYNAGSPVLCVANAAGGLNLDETTVISPTTISGAATSASTIYSASAVAAGSPFRVVGYLLSTQATAGTYAAAASLVQGMGGQALDSLQSFAMSQSANNVVGSRSPGTTYYNSTQRPIYVSVSAIYNATGAVPLITVNWGGANMLIYGGTCVGAGNTSGVQAVIPPGASYTLGTGNLTSLSSWYEMR